MRKVEVTGRTVESLEFGDKSPATVGCWFVECPVSHPVWNQYFVTMVMLRHVEGIKPATINVEGATHEVMVFSLDPNHQQTKESLDTAFATAGKIPILHPINICQQFKAKHDADAMGKVDEILKGTISMDSDFRKLWKYELTGEHE